MLDVNILYDKPKGSNVSNNNRNIIGFMKTLVAKSTKYYTSQLLIKVLPLEGLVLVYVTFHIYI